MWCAVEPWSGSGVDPSGSRVSAAAMPALRGTTGHRVGRARIRADKFVRRGPPPAAYSARDQALASAVASTAAFKNLFGGAASDAGEMARQRREFHPDVFGVRLLSPHFYPEGLANFRKSNLIDLSISVKSGSSRARIGVPDLHSCAQTVARATTDRNVVFAISFPQCHLETVRNQKKRKETVSVSKYIRKRFFQVDTL